MVTRERSGLDSVAWEAPSSPLIETWNRLSQVPHLMYLYYRIRMICTDAKEVMIRENQFLVPFGCFLIEFQTQ